MGRRVGQRGGILYVGLHRRYVGDRWRWGRGTASPDQHGVVLVHRDLVYLDEFELEVLDIRLVQVELAFERPIRDAALTLEQSHRLIQDLLECHSAPPQ